MKSIKERLEDIFKDVFDDEKLVIKKETTAADIEDWDSLAQINLITSIEKEFVIKFSLNEITGLKNVGEMLGLIEKKIG
ncbi:MAG: acyl carrier protein [Fusobacteriaceae bacterium]